MWNGKNKAITFSFDDGVYQDKRLIELLDKYNLKATFNLNSGRLGASTKWNSVSFGGEVTNVYLNPSEIKEVYKNHEIAVHTISHYNLTALTEDTINLQVGQDKQILEELSGREIVGMAYPCGGINSNEYTANVLRESGFVKYARTNKMSFKFDMPKDLLLLDMSVHFAELTKMYELADEFLNKEFSEPACFSIWGHAYELDSEYLNWQQFEEFLKVIANRQDVFYGTNAEVYLNKKES